MFRIVILFFSLNLMNIHAYSQKLDMALGLGSYRVPNQIKFELPREGFNLNFSLTYQLTDRWAMGTGINHSVFNYERASMVDTPMAVGVFNTSGNVRTDHLFFSFYYNFQLPLGLQADLGLGAGAFIDTSEYFFPFNFDEELNAYRGMMRAKEISSGIHFPFHYSLKKVFVDKVSLGLKGGVFLDKNLNTRGVFIGPFAGIIL